MMQASGLQATLTGLVSQLLTGEIGSSASLDTAEGAGFVESMASQIKALMLQRGEDPAEVAALDDADLVSRFFALMQSQTAPAEGGESLGVVWGDALLDGDEDVDDMAPEASEAASLVQASPSQASASGAQSSLPAGSLPTFILQQLAESSQMGGVSLADSASTASRDWLQGLGLGASNAGEVDVASKAVGQVSLDSALGTIPATSTPQVFQVEASKAQSALTDTTGLAFSSMPSEGAAAPANLSTQGQTSRSSEDLGLLDSIADWAGLDATALESSKTSSGAGASADASLEFSLPEMPGAGGEDDARVLEDMTAVTTTGTARITVAGTDVATATGARTPATLDLSNLLRPGGESALADQVKWSLRDGIETAEMKLHPPSLGALDVRISMEGDKAHVQFVSSHPIVREVLEAALPRLREALALDGLALGNVSVSDQAPQERGETGQEQGGRMTAWGVDSEDGEGGEEVVRVDSTLSALSRRLDVFT